MAEVRVSHTTSADPERVWAALLDTEAYASYMDEVRDITIVEWEGNHRLSKWAVRLKGSELQWLESEYIDHENLKVTFEQREGDLAYFDGHWQVESLDGVTVATIYASFDIGIPMMSEMLNPVAARALSDNSKTILERVSDRAAAASTNG